MKNPVKSITFLNTNKILGGGEYLFIRLAKFFADNTEIKIYYIDYKDGVARNFLKNENIEFIDFNPDKKIDINFETCIVTYQNYLFSLINNLNLSEKTKVLLWSIHPYNFLLSLPRFSRYIFYLTPNLKNTKRLVNIAYKEKISTIRKVLKFLYQNNSLIYMDFPNFKINNYCLNLNLDNKNYLAIPTLSIEHSIKSELINENIINIGWLGRLVDFKVYSLSNIIQNSNLYADKYNKKIKIHIIGTGDKEKYIKNHKISKNVELIFLNTVIENELNQYMQNNMDILFAMGTSCLEGAKLHIPSILMDYSYKKINLNYKYKWLFESFEFTLGENANELTRENKHTFEDIINNIYIQKNKKLIGTNCYNYFKENHSIDAIANNLLNYLKNNTFSYSDFINTGICELSADIKQFHKSTKIMKRIKFGINIIKFVFDLILKTETD